MDFICLGIRVPKSGSSSMNHALTAAFAQQRTYFLPDNLNLDGQISRFQDWRFRRAVRRALIGRYGSADLADAYRAINAEAQAGDLVVGGHFDYPTARDAISRPTRIITVLRDPVARSVSEYNYAREGHLRRDVFKRVDSKLQPKIAARYSLVGYLDWLIEHRAQYGDLASRLMGWDGVQPLAAFFAEAVFHAGVLDDVPGFAFGLSEKLGRAVEFPWANSTLTPEAAADAEARRRIEDLYARDFELYEHVRAQTRRAAPVQARPASERRAAADRIEPSAPGAALN